jgi:hypothetical protein
VKVRWLTGTGSDEITQWVNVSDLILYLDSFFLSTVFRSAPFGVCCEDLAALSTVM